MFTMDSNGVSFTAIEVGISENQSSIRSIVPFVNKILKTLIFLTRSYQPRPDTFSTGWTRPRRKAGSSSTRTPSWTTGWAKSEARSGASACQALLVTPCLTSDRRV